MKVSAQIQEAVGKILAQLTEALQGLSEDDYKKPLNVLSQSSIGQHTRHIIEFFKVLIDQYEHAEVNYDNRERNHLLENDKAAALNAIAAIGSSICLQDKAMQLTGVYDSASGNITVNTTFHRELIYNLEHAIHHMAMIKIGFLHFSNMQLSPEFGVAASTMLHKQSIG